MRQIGYFGVKNYTDLINGASDAVRDRICKEIKKGKMLKNTRIIDPLLSQLRVDIKACNYGANIFPE